MTTERRGARAALPAFLMLAPMMSSMPAAAQTTPTAPVRGLEQFAPPAVQPSPQPTTGATPVPFPAAPTILLPTATPTPGASPSPRPTVRASRATPSAAPTVIDRAAARPTPTPIPTPVVTPSSPVTPVATATPAVTPTPTVTPSSTPVPAAPTVTGSDATTGHGPWPWLTIGAVVLLAFAGWMLARGRRPAEADEERASPAVPPPIDPTPIDPTPIPAGPRARLTIALRPIRAGLNMLSATVEAEVVVANTGDAAATQVRVHATLLSAHAAQEADLAAAFAAPAGRPAAPPFALAPGEERRVRVVAALSREAVRSIDVGGRPMFVPLVAIDLRYAADDDGTPARLGQAFIVGVERVDSAKLAPFWLDGPLRMHDQVAARVQGPAVLG